MMDLGWSEMAVIALVALLVLGPKELPNALRTVALWVRKARKLAREFQSGVDELVREAELEEAKKTVQSVSRVNVNRELEKTIDPTGEVSRAMTSDPDAAAKPPTATPASAATGPARPAAPDAATGNGAGEPAPAAGPPTESGPANPSLDLGREPAEAASSSKSA